MDVWFIWDLPSDPRGNVAHIAQHHVTVDEVEQVLRDRRSLTSVSRSSGLPITFGRTKANRKLAVVWENVSDDPTAIYPITAYDVE